MLRENQLNNYNIDVHDLGITEYDSVWQKMKNYSKTRTDHSSDLIWFTEHEAIYTLGQNGKNEHIINPGKIKILKVDRGGQVTYHGPGQIMMYTLIDIKRIKLNIRQLILILEESIINLLSEYKVSGHRRRNAPGVYVDSKKIASIGLRITRGTSYHGLALNYNTDLKAFSGINTCGYKDLDIINMNDLGIDENKKTIQMQLAYYFKKNLFNITSDST